MPHWKLYLFGPPRLECDSQPVEIALRKALALLAYLAITQQTHSRDALATLLWPESNQSKARGGLRRTLHRLNQTLDTDILIVEPEGIALRDSADLWLDVAAYQELVANHLPQESSTIDLSAERFLCLTKAADLYTDDFLAGFTLPDSTRFDDCQFFQCEALHQSLGQVLKYLVIACQKQNDYEQAISHARRWVALDPLHEPIHRQLMQLYALTGQQAAAIRQYQECKRILNQEMGVSTEEETTALHEAIRTKHFPVLPTRTTRKRNSTHAFGSTLSLTTPQSMAHEPFHGSEAVDSAFESNDKMMPVREEQSVLSSHPARHLQQSNLTVDSTARVEPTDSVEPDSLLLTTKLYIPPVRHDLVRRHHLIQRLNEGLNRKLTLISAPAGFGKTTLLSEWRSTSPISELPFAWLSLDEEDNDPTRFRSYLFAALQQMQAGYETDSSFNWKSVQPSLTKRNLAVLINEMAAVPTDFVFVLDDYHLINSETIHEDLRFLLGHIPPQMHMVVASRTEPPLPLARLRGRGQLTELRADDLRFGLEEVSSFLNQIMELNLSAEQLATLDTRTEGWIAGLQMAALSMQGRTDIPGFIAAFGGDDRHILDYLVEEVLAQQPEGLRSFLLQTSILDRLSGPLCDAVTSQVDGQVMLEALERANLFIIPLDDQRHWYRYHHLFAEVLGNRLERTAADQKPELHRRATQWYEKNGLLIEALNHALTAKDFEVAARLLEQILQGGVGPIPGEVTATRRWLKALPETVMNGRPLLCIENARLLMRAEQYQAAEASLEQADCSLAAKNREDVKSSDDVLQLRLWVISQRMTIAGHREEVSQIEELSRQLLDLLPENERIYVDWDLVVAYLDAGEAVAAEQAFARVIQRLAKRNETRHPNLFWWAGDVYQVRGRLHQALENYCQFLHLTEQAEEQEPPGAIGRTYAWMAEIQYEQNDLDGAMQSLQKSIEIGQQWDSPMVLLYGYRVLARLYSAKRDQEKATDTMQKLTQLIQQFDEPQVPRLGKAAQVRHWLAQDETSVDPEQALEAANRWAQTSGMNAHDEPRKRYLVEHLTLARVLIAQNRSDAALRLLTRHRQKANGQGRMWNEIEVLALQAVALQAQGDIEQAVTILERVLSLAEPEGYIRTFVDEGESMARLLHIAASRDIAPQYVAKLLAAFEETDESMRRPKPSADLPTPQSFVEPLSERELDLLHLLAQGLTNRQISERLFITVGTVKVHLSNIYGKLNVHNRTQAVTQARELNMLQ